MNDDGLRTLLAHAAGSLEGHLHGDLAPRLIICILLAGKKGNRRRKQHKEVNTWPLDRNE
jgi:hypothetical protein